MKIVREHINEFERSDNSLKNLGIGKKALIKQWLDNYNVRNYVINDDFTIDVIGYVNLSEKQLDSVPDYIKFNKVGGYFDCSYNKLTSLEFCPNEVGESFFCNDNDLTSLNGCPKKVRVNFWCENNKKQFTIKDVSSKCIVKIRTIT
jgi:hypothetical protein